MKDWGRLFGHTKPLIKRQYNQPLFALVYGVETVLPLELQIPSLRIVIQEGLTKDENHKLCLAELEAFNERRLQAQ